MKLSIFPLAIILLSLSIILGLYAMSYALAMSKLIIPRLCLFIEEVCISFFMIIESTSVFTEVDLYRR